MSEMFKKAFLLATLERMVRGAAIAVGFVWFGTDVVFDVMEINTWEKIGAAAISGAVGSLVLSLAGRTFGSGDGPSFTNVEKLNPVA
jgi:hypothetical protein